MTYASSLAAEFLKHKKAQEKFRRIQEERERQKKGTPSDMQDNGMSQDECSSTPTLRNDDFSPSENKMPVICDKPNTEPLSTQTLPENVPPSPSPDDSNQGDSHSYVSEHRPRNLPEHALVPSGDAPSVMPPTNYMNAGGDRQSLSHSHLPIESPPPPDIPVPHPAELVKERTKPASPLRGRLTKLPMPPMEEDPDSDMERTPYRYYRTKQQYSL